MEIVFECGCKIPYEKTRPNYKRVCQKHKKEVDYILKPCADCGALMKLGKWGIRTKRCDTCAAAQKKVVDEKCQTNYREKTKDVKAMYFVFECGCKTEYVRFKAHKIHVCPKCETDISHVLKPCIDCDTMMKLGTRANCRKRCDDCNKKRMQEQSRNSYKNYVKKHGVRRYDNRKKSPDHEAVGADMRRCEYAMSLKDVGKAMGVTRERIRQIEVAALRKFRKNYRKLFPDSEAGLFN